ncbi:hypothetical protein [Paracoccus contaminans]|uniref:hypothetical protein n=1 Tax=Paracoccus contaminans TaxID=1945662 RepID=UPI0012F4A727|nr:hypothetical protein [Paracoccus contaminans]
MDRPRLWSRALASAGPTHRSAALSRTGAADSENAPIASAACATIIRPEMPTAITTGR